MTPTNRKWSSLMDSSSLVDCDPVKDRMLWKITTGAVKHQKEQNMSFILLAVKPNDLKLERVLCDLKGKSIWCCLTLFSLGLIWSRSKQSYFTLFPIPNLTNIVIHLSSTIKLSFPDLYQLSSETIPRYTMDASSDRLDSNPGRLDLMPLRLPICWKDFTLKGFQFIQLRCKLHLQNPLLKH